MPDTADILFRAGRFLRHQLSAKGAESIHSPFIFSFYQEVVQFPYDFSVFEELASHRQKLLEDKTILKWKEHGAGNFSETRRISAIARSSLMPHRKAAFLFKLSRWLKPKAVMELGTSLGLTTAYLAVSGLHPVYTFEAVESLGQEADKLWSDLKIKSIRQIMGPVEETLPSFFDSNHALNWELAIVDAHHRYLPTMQNFHLLNKSRVNRPACIVFDDVYWSREMAAAWREIQDHPEVDASIDLFDFGIVFFRPELSRQKFVLKW